MDIGRPQRTTHIRPVRLPQTFPAPSEPVETPTEPARLPDVEPTPAPTPAEPDPVPAEPVPDRELEPV